jgi:NAD(P)H-flavin reductase
MAFEADPWLPRPFRVRRRVRETADTVSFFISPETESAPCAFSPGQFSMLYAFGAGEAPISISGDPDAPGTLMHTIRSVGAVTKALARLRAGDPVGVRGPYGTGWPLDRCEGADVVVVGGGLGLAPLRPALHRLAAHRRRYGRVTLLYGARTPKDVLFSRDLLEWRRGGGIDVEVTVDLARGDYRGRVGLVTDLIPRASFDPAHSVALVCGPETMMRFATAALLRRGVAQEDIFLSMERNMKCALGFCGHCQLGPAFVCKDGPVLRFDRLLPWLSAREV